MYKDKRLKKKQNVLIMFLICLDYSHDTIPEDGKGSHNLVNQEQITSQIKTFLEK
jgi:hypothetical protein